MADRQSAKNPGGLSDAQVLALLLSKNNRELDVSRLARVLEAKQADLKREDP